MTPILYSFLHKKLGMCEAMCQIVILKSSRFEIMVSAKCGVRDMSLFSQLCRSSNIPATTKHRSAISVLYCVLRNFSPMREADICIRQQSYLVRTQICVCNLPSCVKYLNLSCKRTCICSSE
jgi:4-hydroxy-3-methylbut-2-en-1-yl diphosphate synthase IspG/GcpE